MDQKPSDRRSAGMFIASMLIFGTIGVFRRYIPVSSAFLAFSAAFSVACASCFSSGCGGSPPGKKSRGACCRS